MRQRKKTRVQAWHPTQGPTIFSGIPHLDVFDRASAQMIELLWVRPFITFTVLWKVMLSERAGMNFSKTAGQW